MGGSVDPQLRLARRALETGRLAGARAACAEALRRDPTCAKAYVMLGEIARSEGYLAQAVELFRRAHALEPRRLGPLVWMATTLVASHRLPEAREAAYRALALGPNGGETLNTLGVVLGRVGDHDRAVLLFKSAATHAPHNHSYQFNLGCALQEVGRFEEATSAFRLCTKLAPDQDQAYIALAELNRQTPNANLAPLLEGRFRAALAAAEVERALALGHALAKSLEDLGDPIGAMDRLGEAKALRLRRTPYDDARDTALFAAAESHVPSRRPARGPVADERPIFVIGMPRSGTTLVERILSSHPEVGSVGESLAFPLLVRRMTRDASPQLASARVFILAEGLDPDRLGAEYVRYARALAAGKGRTIDKLPFNFFYARLIHQALPGARIVCVRRDPVDTGVSNYRTLFGQASPFHDYAYALGDIARYQGHFHCLIGRWRETLPPDRFLELRYEALIADQEAETRRLLAFCDLSWNARCLAFDANQTGVATASVFAVRQPLFTTSVGRWRRYGDRVAPLVEALACDVGSEPSRPGLPEPA